MDLDEKQNEAVEKCANPALRTVAVTGPAGTGKTTIMRRVYDVLESKGFKPVVAAPTGKAAKRISEATGLPASTIHRLLEFTHPGELDEAGKPIGDSYPRRTRVRPLEYTAVLCDEYSMVPYELHQCLIEAMPMGSVLRVFGDANQLAPIENLDKFKNQPSPFVKILNDFEGVRLETIHRTGKGSGIASNGARILQGKVPMKHEDFDLSVGMDVTAALFDRLRSDEAKGIRYDSVDNQIITPRTTSVSGTIALNQLLQSYYIDRDPDAVRPFMDVPRYSKNPKDGARQRMFVGEKVICIRNNYDLNIFNGESGIIEEVDGEFGMLTVNFGDKIVSIPPVMEYFGKNREVRSYDPRKGIELAYAVTTHKAQGSEYKNVIYIVTTACAMLRTRRNLYTAVTRARERCTVLSDAKSLAYAVWNTREL